MAYTKTAIVTAHITTGLAEQYNSLWAELKAAMEGISTHDIDIAIAYNGNLVDTITLTDNSATAGHDIDCVGTCSYTGN